MSRFDPGGIVERVVDTEVGSQGVREGVRREFRFVVMESSVVDRERRRKSMGDLRSAYRSSFGIISRKKYTSQGRLVEAKLWCQGRWIVSS